MLLQNYGLTLGKKKLFFDVNVNFEKGNIYHLLGGNGVGKSSFAKSTLNLLHYTGTIDAQNCSLCVIGSYTNIPNDLKIKDVISILKTNSVLKYFDELYELLRIKEIDHKIKLYKMSDGQRQKIKLLVFLANNPDIIILDEFTASLDKKTMLEIYEFIREYSKRKDILIINISHNLLDLEYLKGRYYYITNQKMVLYEDKDILINDYVHLL